MIQSWSVPRGPTDVVALLRVKCATFVPGWLTLGAAARKNR
jgi:hypothetical protein